MRTLAALLLTFGVIHLAFNFSAPGILPDFGFDPFVLGGICVAVGVVFLMIDENARNKRKWKMGPLK